MILATGRLHGRRKQLVPAVGGHPPARATGALETDDGPNGRTLSRTRRYPHRTRTGGDAPAAGVVTPAGGCRWPWRDVDWYLVPSAYTKAKERVWEEGMTTGRTPDSRTVTKLTPAAEQGEHWWPVALAIIAVAGLHVALPARYRVQPAWVVPVVLLALLAVLIAGDPGRIDRQKTWLRILMGVVIAFITLANLLAAVRLMADLLTNDKLFAHNSIGLLSTGGVIWATNVVAFGLWYWDLDRGGAAARAHHPDRNPAFVFPEMLHTDYAGTAWVPQFIDYLSLAFWTATAVSPTDISAIKPWAKSLMMLEAAASIGLGVLVIGYAVNIL